MRARAVWAVQLAVAALVVWFVARTLSQQLADLRSLRIPLAVEPGWIGLSAVTVLATYGALIAAWNAILRGWGEALRFPVAARIWAVSNLGRYLPGKVWTVAGLALLAQRQGVSGVAAGASALAMQAISLGTGAVVVAIVLPAGMLPAAVSPGLVLLVGGAALSLIVGLSATNLAALLGRVTGRVVEVRPLPPRAAMTAAATTLVAWVSYGAAFWMLGRGIVGTAGPTLLQSIGVFAGGYIVGLIAVFAPGGLGVREVVFLGMLAPSVGAGTAGALAVSSRLLLTITELVAAAAAYGISQPRNRGDAE